MNEELTLVLKGVIIYCPATHSIIYRNEECFTIELDDKQEMIIEGDVTPILLGNDDVIYVGRYLFLMDNGNLILTNREEPGLSSGERVTVFWKWQP